MTFASRFIPAQSTSLAPRISPIRRWRCPSRQSYHFQGHGDYWIACRADCGTHRGSSTDPFHTAHGTSWKLESTPQRITNLNSRSWRSIRRMTKAGLWVKMCEMYKRVWDAKAQWDKQSKMKCTMLRLQRILEATGSRWVPRQRHTGRRRQRQQESWRTGSSAWKQNQSCTALAGSRIWPGCLSIARDVELWVDTRKNVQEWVTGRLWFAFISSVMPPQSQTVGTTVDIVQPSTLQERRIMTWWSYEQKSRSP